MAEVTVFAACRFQEWPAGLWFTLKSRQEELVHRPLALISHGKLPRVSQSYCTRHNIRIRAVLAARKRFRQLGINRSSIAIERHTKMGPRLSLESGPSHRPHTYCEADV